MEKSPDAFRTISEVSELLDTPAHVLRFWESRFPQIKPVKRAGGRRYYRPSDMALLAGIRRLLHDEGITIRGVQKILREQGVKHVAGLTDEGAEDDGPILEGIIGLTPAPRDNTPIPLFPERAEASPPDTDARQQPASQQDSAAPQSDEIAASITEPELDFATLPTPADAAEADGADGSADSMPVDPVGETLAVRTADEPSEGYDRQVSAAQDIGAADPAVFEHPPGSQAEQHAATGSVSADALPPSGAADDAAAPASEDHQGAESPPVLSQSDSAPEAPRDATSLPPALPPVAEITGHWLPADLRTLYPGDFGDKRERVAALLSRLEALRNRVGELGRVPHR